MEIEWLEDFILLAQVKNFSRAAELSNITQPAFSRRIQSLELWLGAPLVDRSCFPLELTSSGKYFYEEALTLVENIRDMRKTLKCGALNHDLVIDFAAPHNLSLTFFPEWVRSISQHLGDSRYRLKALNVHDAVMTLVSGSSDLLIAYSHPSTSLKLDPRLYPYKTLGSERISLFGKAGVNPPEPNNLDARIPYLAYGPSAYLGKIVNDILAQASKPVHLKKVFETDMAEGLKAMLLAGHGYAFLPESSVKNELNDGTIIKAFTENGKSCLDAVVEIRLYREVGEGLIEHERMAQTNKHVHAKKEVIESLWNNL